MNRIKSNPYNYLIPIPENNDFLLYNTLSNGLEVVKEQEGVFLTELFLSGNFFLEDHPEHSELLKYLYKKEYLLNSDVDLIQKLSNNIDDNQYRNPKIINLTIGTTITCNMGCAYCFEFIKPNHTLKKKEVKDQIISYVEQIITDQENDVDKIAVTWYGGEPLINTKAIIELSPLLIALAKKYNLDYTAKIITNGIYLTTENWHLLSESKVDSVQITIDGAKEHHNKKRPLKQKNKKNYDLILENLTKIPNNFNGNVNIRLNVDKEVASSAFELLNDFEKLNIWPQNYKKISFDPAWLRTYDEIDISEEEEVLRMTIDDFFHFKQSFRDELVSRFNEFYKDSRVKKAKLKWDLPNFQSACATWASPISLTIDPNGNIHKCWETIHDDTKAPSSVFETYNRKKYNKYQAFNRYSHNDVCKNCKVLPICDTITCSYEAIKAEVPRCSSWKYTLEGYLKSQYLRMISNEESITMPLDVESVNTGHSAK